MRPTRTIRQRGHGETGSEEAKLKEHRIKRISGAGDRPADDRPTAGAAPDGRLALGAAFAWAMLALLLPWGAGALLGGTGVAAGVAWWAWWRRRTGRRSAAVALGAVATAGLLAAGAGQVAVRAAGGLADLAEQRAVVTLEGRISADPTVLRTGEERAVERVLVPLDVSLIEGRGRQVSVATRVLVVAPGGWAERRWWESIRVTGRLAPADPGQNVVAVLVPTAAPHVLGAPGVVADVAEHVRGRLRAASADVPPDAQGLVPGLVIGDTSQAPAALTDDMRTTGMSHLSAVSGSNVAIVLAAALAMARGLGLRRRWRPAWAAVVLLVFVVIARPEPSVVRAAVMGGVALVGMQGSRRGAGLPALGAATLVVLLVDPWLARSYGFALSVLATAGLLLLARPWAAAIAARLPSRAAFVGEAIAIPLAAQVVCAPVVVLLSGSVTTVGVLANLLAAPLVAPATVLGVTAALVAAVHVGAGSVLVALAALPTLGIAGIAHQCARAPYATLPWPEGVGGALLLTGLTALALATGPRLLWSARRRPGVALATVCLACAAVVPVPGGACPDPDWRLAVCDVGQGDALVLRSSASAAVLVDAGPPGSDVGGCLRRLRVECLDAVVLTHLHDDHSGGIDDVLASYPVREVFLGTVDDPPEEAARVQRVLASHQLVAGRLTGGDALAWPWFRALVRAPQARVAAGSVPNNNSLVLDVRWDGLRALLLADLEREGSQAVARELARAGDAGGVDIVKVAHHGSANHNRGLLELLRPRAFVISVGRDNDFGHPAPSLLTTLAGIGRPVYRTDRDGDVVVAVRPGGPVVQSGG